MVASSPKSTALQDNFGVEYVIRYKFEGKDKSQAVQSFRSLTQSLAHVGLATAVRNGGDGSVLVFVKVASEEHLFGEVYRSRVRDWIHGVRAAAPDKETRRSLEDEPLTEAERLRIVYQLMTNPKKEGGAGITPKEGEWANVDAIFALHDHAYNKQWIKQWSTAYFLKPEDLDAIRDRLGEKIAFYFAFTQSYFSFLLFPAVFGFSCWLLIGSFSPIYAIVNGLWCIVFTEYWKHQEHDLGVRWGVRGVSAIETRRKEFRHEKEIEDPVTGELVQFFPSSKRFQRQLLQVPFALVAAVGLGSLIATCFGIEIFISEVYSGRFQSVLTFLPTAILSTCMPLLTALFTSFANKLNDLENWETDGQHQTALTQKIFVLNFITSYLPIILTAFVYVPFGSLLVPYLDVFSLTVKPFAENEKQMETPSTSTFTINPDRLTKQVIYFTVTAQVVNLAMEVVVPYLKRRGMNKFKQMQNERAAKKNGNTSHADQDDHAEEKDFLTRVRSESELEVYDVAGDLREMVVQFGYLSLFSVIWPLTSVSFLINDWVELRADAIKICVEMQRPIPWRADTIGPWLDNLSFLTWLGSVTTGALVYLFHQGGPSGTPESVKGWALLLSVIFSEHLFFLVRFAVKTAISKLDSPGLQKERRDRFLVRKRYFEESLDELDKLPRMEEVPVEKITRSSLEEDARQSTLHSASPSDRFWARQRNWSETAEVGRTMIEQAHEAEGKKQK